MTPYDHLKAKLEHGKSIDADVIRVDIEELASVLDEVERLRNLFKPISKIVHCPICDNAIFSDMKYCDRCGAEQG